MLKYVRANLVEDDTPVFPGIISSDSGASIDFSGPGTLYLIVGLFKTRQQFRSDDRTLVGLEFEGLLQDMSRSVSHKDNLTTSASPRLRVIIVPDRMRERDGLLLPRILLA